MSKLTVTIPDDLHQQIRDELERQGITTSQFIEQAVTTFFEKPKGVSNRATRTLLTKRQGTVFSCAAHLLTIAAETP